VRDGIVPAEKINLPADIARLYAGNRRVDGATSGERAAYDGEVFPADHTLLHGFAEQGGGEHVFGDDDQTTRVGIQPVDAAERSDFTFCTVISRDGVCKRIPLVHGRRVYRHACRLVNHQKILVLVTDREGNLLRKNGSAGSLLFQMETEKITGVKHFIHMCPHTV